MKNNEDRRKRKKGNKNLISQFKREILDSQIFLDS